MTDIHTSDPAAWMTHHDEPMIFPTLKEAAAYCDDDEQPIPLYAHPPRPEASAALNSEWLCRVYTDAYHAGHNATVEGEYVDVWQADRDTYWLEHVESEYPEALAQQPAAVDEAMVKQIRQCILMLRQHLAVFTQDSVAQAMFSEADALTAALAAQQGEKS